MKPIKCIILCFLLGFFKSYACLNGESKLLKSKDYLYMDRADRLPFGHEFFTRHYYEAMYKLDSLYQKTHDVAYLSDKGLILILRKEYKEALQLYLDIEKRAPNRYSTASNLGTVYELMGKNEEALKWIKKAVSINPKSHMESEWIHVKILEAKIKGEAYFTGKFLLDVDFGDADQPLSEYSQHKLNKLDSALYYQLNERISFIKPKDKIISVLLFELGNVRMLKKNFRDANALFEKANEYGLQGELLERRMTYAKKHFEKPRLYKVYRHTKAAVDYPKTITLVLSIITVIILIFIFVKRRK